MTMQHFWKRWRGEYLLQLRECHQQSVKGKPQPLKQGDIVLVHNEKHPRGLWKIAKIERLLEGADGQVRGAVVRVPSKSSSKVLRHPLNCLYLLEVECAESVDPIDARNDVRPQKTNEEAQLSGDVKSQSRPKRAAAQRANQFLKTVASQLRET